LQAASAPMPRAIARTVVVFIFHSPVVVSSRPRPDVMELQYAHSCFLFRLFNKFPLGWTRRRSDPRSVAAAAKEEKWET
jgi:hypothetical protein